jgi:hypothetical protein
MALTCHTDRRRSGSNTPLKEKPLMSNNDIATRVTQGVQALGVPGQREGWQSQHRESLLKDAEIYSVMADAEEADARARKVKGDKPWSAALRARRRVKPLRKAAKSMRRAARDVSGTVAAFEETAPEKVLADRQAKELHKARKRGELQAAAQNLTAETLRRLAPADTDGDASGAPKTLGDYFNGTRKGA